MDNYTWPEGEKTVSEPLHSIKLDENTIHMQVKSGSKVSNLTSYAFTKFEKDEFKQITWNGTGDAITKVVACAEIMKKRIKGLYQINKSGFQKSEEVWKAKLEELRDIKVTKEIPAMCIILSKTPLNPDEPGYQFEETVNKPTKSPSAQGSKIDEARGSGRKSESGRGSDKNKPINIDNDDSIYVKKQKTRKPFSDEKAASNAKK